MPIANIQIIEGRTDEQKAKLIERVTDAICQSLGSKPEAVRIIIQDIPRTHWGIGGQTARELGR
ncbi:2-hydroxymuconate tautomerase [Rhodocyclaceae bacterium SMB388]